MSSRIEQIIEEIEEYIDGCPFKPLSTSKIIVNKDHIDELLRELRMKTPDEIKRYQKIISNKDAILADAQAKADSMLEEAHVQTNELVSEHEIMPVSYTHLLQRQFHLVPSEVQEEIPVLFSLSCSVVSQRGSRSKMCIRDRGRCLRFIRKYF